MSSSEEGEGRGGKKMGLGNYPENSNYIRRRRRFRVCVCVCCSCLPVRSRGWRQCGSERWHRSSPVLRSALNQMIDNNWNHTEPGANYRSWGSLPQMCCLSAFMWRLLKRIFCLPYKCYGSVRETFCRLAGDDLWKAEISRWPHQTHTAPTSPDSSDVCQYDVEHKRVMFNRVKAAICVWDARFNSASSGLSGFPSILQVLAPFSVKLGRIRLDGKLK